MDEDVLRSEIERLEEQIADLKKRWPAHSVKVSMVQELEELEERLAQLYKMEKEKEGNPGAG